MVKRCALTAVCLLLLLRFAFTQSSSELVNRMVQNELAALKNDHSQWMYRDRNSLKGMVKLEEVIETPEGSMRRLLSVNGKSPTSDQEKKSQEAIKRFLTDPNYRKQQRQKTDEDTRKASKLLATLPKAFLYSSEAREGQMIRLAFRPNPGFQPPHREAKVFHAMAGMLLIDSKQMRLAKLSGHLVKNVDFGGGILGKLRKGGSFEVNQADAGVGHWKLTKLVVHMSGHVLFFATINQQQDEVMSDFHEVPPGTTLAKAADLLKGVTDIATLQSNGAHRR